ncbi:hypothetical protein RIF29_28950 [Crotalaria pallida]|uniref:Uncharacterized protein n=1 Tax=Crotalaria pallida TaxID=3830 RepID=A0AAN9EDQ3_CROPI
MQKQTCSRENIWISLHFSLLCLCLYGTLSCNQQIVKSTLEFFFVVYDCMFILCCEFYFVLQVFYHFVVVIIFD